MIVITSTAFLRGNQVAGFFGDLVQWLSKLLTSDKLTSILAAESATSWKEYP